MKLFAVDLNALQIAEIAGGSTVPGIMGTADLLPDIVGTAGVAEARVETPVFASHPS